MNSKKRMKEIIITITNTEYSIQFYSFVFYLKIKSNLPMQLC